MLSIDVNSLMVITSIHDKFDITAAINLPYSTPVSNQVCDEYIISLTNFNK
jgi:hypothetical protein